MSLGAHFDASSGARAMSWLPVTPGSPDACEDVMVTAWDAAEKEAVVFMAWRAKSDPGRWLISGSDEPLLLPVFAWQPVVAPCAQVPASLKAPRVNFEEKSS